MSGRYFIALCQLTSLPLSLADDCESLDIVDLNIDAIEFAPVGRSSIFAVRISASERRASRQKTPMHPSDVVLLFMIFHS